MANQLGSVNVTDLLQKIADDVSQIKNSLFTVEKLRHGDSLIPNASSKKSSKTIGTNGSIQLRGPSEWTKYVMQVRAETGLKMAEAMAEATRRREAGLWSPSNGSAAGAGGAAEAEGGRRRKRKTRKGKKRSYRKRTSK